MALLAFLTLMSTYISLFKGNTFWKNGVHAYSTVPQTCKNLHQGALKMFWWLNTELIHMILILPLIRHPCLCVRCYTAVLPPAPHLLQLVYPTPKGVQLYALLAYSAVQLSDGLLLLCAVALSLIT